jgi:hypothetical protein
MSSIYRNGAPIAVGEKFIKFKSGVRGNVTDYTLNVLANILRDANQPYLIITSLQRTPRQQASAMYNNIVSKGVASQYNLYGSGGDAIINVYVSEKAKSSTPTEIKNAMTSAIVTNDWQYDHRADGITKAVVDISFRELKSIGTMTVSLQKWKNKGVVSKFIDESDHFHVEIPQKNSDGTNKASENTSSVNRIDGINIVANKFQSSSKYSGKFLSDLTDSIESSPIYGSDPLAISRYEYEGKSNNERLWSVLPLEYKKLIGQNDGSYNSNVVYPLTRLSIIYIPSSEIYTIPEDELVKGGNQDSTGSQTSHKSGSKIKEYSSNITLMQSKEGKYYPKVLKYMSADPGFTPLNKFSESNIKDIYPRLRVHVWSRILHNQTGNGYIDVTSDIVSLSVNSTMEGTEITIQLASCIGRIVSENNDLNVWSKDDSVGSINLGNINRPDSQKDGRSNEVFGINYIRNNQYYEKILQQNDMVFIRFEELISDINTGISIEDLVTKGWHDSIGLLDYVNVKSNASNTDVSIDVVGRDLTKMFIEDNSFFNTYSIGHAESLYGGDVGSNSRFGDNVFLDVDALMAKSIKESLEFIFHRISSIGYVPDEIFNLFRGLTKVSVVTKKDGKNISEVRPSKGAWQLVKFWIDENISDIRLVDDSVSRPNGSIWDLMKKVCQDPFIEIFTETLGTQFYVIVRKPPFEQKILTKIVEDLQPYQEEYLNEVEASNRYVKYLDCLKANRDKPAEGESYNDIINTKKLARGEFARGAGLEDFKQNGLAFQDDSESNCSEELRKADDAIYPTMINVLDSDVLSESLMQTQTAYSWYQVTDKGNFAGHSVVLSHIPAVYFDEYAQIFGNRKLDVVNNYSDYKFFDNKNKDKGENLYAEQASQLLSYLVETNIHLPFTREGSITINGDRRIKKGTYIYYAPTREVFYVTGVSNSISIANNIDRTTTLTVSRGMVIDFIKGHVIDVEELDGSTSQRKVSYFNIIDIQKFKEDAYDVVANGVTSDKFNYKSKMKLDIPIMNFFLNKKQFFEKDIIY